MDRTKMDMGACCDLGDIKFCQNFKESFCHLKLGGNKKHDESQPGNHFFPLVGDWTTSRQLSCC